MRLKSLKLAEEWMVLKGRTHSAERPPLRVAVAVRAIGSCAVPGRGNCKHRDAEVWTGRKRCGIGVAIGISNFAKPRMIVNVTVIVVPLVDVNRLTRGNDLALGHPK